MNQGFTKYTFSACVLQLKPAKKKTKQKNTIHPPNNTAGISITQAE